MEQQISQNLSQTASIAQQIIAQAKPNLYLLLSGDLGAGKTTFTKLFLKQLGVTENVSSPTFVIMNQYIGNHDLKINHLDAYRLNHDSEIEMFIDEFAGALNIIEWYENLNLDLDNINWIKIDIKILNETNREFRIEEK